MKRVKYVGNAQAEIAAFPDKAKQRIMTALIAISADIVLGPKDFKYMPTVGAGCYELRIKVDRQYRVFYVAKFYEAIYVLHAFVKKTQKTAKTNLDLGSLRYKVMVNYRREKKYDKKD